MSCAAMRYLMVVILAIAAQAADLNHVHRRGRQLVNEVPSLAYQQPRQDGTLLLQQGQAFQQQLQQQQQQVEQQQQQVQQQQQQQQVQQQQQQVQQQQQQVQQQQQQVQQQQPQQQFISQQVQETFAQNQQRFDQPESSPVQIQAAFDENEQQNVDAQAGVFFDAGVSSANSNEGGVQGVTTLEFESSDGDGNNLVSGVSFGQQQTGSVSGGQGTGSIVQSFQSETVSGQGSIQQGSSSQSFSGSDAKQEGSTQESYGDAEATQSTGGQVSQGSIQDFDQPQTQEFQVSSFQQSQVQGQPLPLPTDSGNTQEFQFTSQEPQVTNVIQTSDIRSFTNEDSGSFSTSNDEFSVPDLTQPEIEERPVQAVQTPSGQVVGTTRPFQRPQQTRAAFARRIDSSHCGAGLLSDINGDCVEPEVSRNIFLYAAPLRQRRLQASVRVPKPKLEYNIVFVRNPERESESAPVIIPPPQRKTLVYVLNKKTKEDELGVVEAPSHPPLQPEVFFVNYEDGQNPELPGGIDLRTALEEMALEGQVIGGAAAAAGVNDRFLLGQQGQQQAVTNVVQTVQIEEEPIQIVTEGDDSGALFVAQVQETNTQSSSGSLSQITPGYNYNTPN